MITSRFDNRIFCCLLTSTCFGGEQGIQASHEEGVGVSARSGDLVALEGPVHDPRGPALEDGLLDHSGVDDAGHFDNGSFPMALSLHLDVEHAHIQPEVVLNHLQEWKKKRERENSSKQRKQKLTSTCQI